MRACVCHFFCVILQRKMNRALAAKKMKGDITMVATQLNPTQLYLLQLFSFSQTEESQLDLQNVLLSYYKEKVAKRANELWDKLDLDQHKLDEMCSIHERLPYQ